MRKKRTPHHGLTSTPIRKIVRDRFALNFRQTYLLCAFMVIALGVYYVWILNVNANSGYRARQLEIDRKAAEVEKNLLRVSVAEQESLEELF